MAEFLPMVHPDMPDARAPHGELMRPVSEDQRQMYLGRGFVEVNEDGTPLEPEPQPVDADGAPIPTPDEPPVSAPPAPMASDADSTPQPRRTRSGTAPDADASTAGGEG